MSDNDNNKVETDEWGIPAVFKGTWFGEILRFSSKWERDSGELLDSIQKIRGMVEVYETYSGMEREAGTQDTKRTYGCAAARLAVAIVTAVKNDTKRFFGKEVEVDIDKVKPFLRDMDGRVRARLADARRAGEAMRRLPLTLLKVADLPEKDKNELQAGFEKLDARLVERIRQLDAEGESRVPAICEFATDLADMYERRVYEVFKYEVAKMRTQVAYTREDLITSEDLMDNLMDKMMDKMNNHGVTVNGFTLKGRRATGSIVYDAVKKREKVQDAHGDEDAGRVRKRGAGAKPKRDTDGAQCKAMWKKSQEGKYASAHALAGAVIMAWTKTTGNPFAYSPSMTTKEMSNVRTALIKRFKRWCRTNGKRYPFERT